jgi:DNA ligase-1
VHLLPDGSVKIFSRNSLDDTKKFPEIVKSFSSLVAKGVTSCVIDSECVAWDHQLKTIKPFQELSRRSKKGDGEESQVRASPAAG